MRRVRIVGIYLVSICLLSGLASVVSADVSVGDVVGKKDWEKAEGLLPEAILGWLQNGDFEMKVGELNYDPKEYRNPAAVKSLEANRGKYDLDAEDVIIDKATGELPEYIEGIPFPEPDLDVNDPKAGAKIMYNKFYSTYVQGNEKFPFGTIWLSRDGGFEREVKCEWQQYPLDGFAAHSGQKNKEGYERFALIRVLAPFDIAGTNILLMRYRGMKSDTTLAYVPAIRRVRRMSPANRSDSFIGSDACVDDAWCFDGKVTAFKWKLLRKQEALMPYLDEDPQPLVKGKLDAWMTGKDMKQIEYGYQNEEWTGAPWMPTNLVWVKRPVYVIKMTPRDPYYNYGTQYMWVDAEVNLMTTYKIIHDRAEKYWKVMWYSYSAYASPDGAMKMVSGGSMVAVDDRTNHGTIIRFPEPDNTWTFFAKLDKNNYSLGGFQKLCK